MKNILSTILLFALLSHPATAQVRITEFMASNTHTLLDEDGDSSDWIEIQNTSNASRQPAELGVDGQRGQSGQMAFPGHEHSARIVHDRLCLRQGPRYRRPGIAYEFQTFRRGRISGAVRAGRLGGHGNHAAVSTAIPGCFLRHRHAARHDHVGRDERGHSFCDSDECAVDATWTQTNFDDSSWPAGTNGIGYETGIIDPQEESFAAKVLATQPEAYWRLNETNGTTAANLGSGGVSEDQGGYMGNIVLGQAGPRNRRHSRLSKPITSRLISTARTPTVNGPFELVNDLAAFTIAGWIYPTAAQGSRSGLFGQNDTMEFGFSLGVNHPNLDAGRLGVRHLSLRQQHLALHYGGRRQRPTFTLFRRGAGRQHFDFGADFRRVGIRFQHWRRRRF